MQSSNNTKCSSRSIFYRWCLALNINLLLCIAGQFDIENLPGAFHNATAWHWTFISARCRVILQKVTFKIWVHFFFINPSCSNFWVLCSEHHSGTNKKVWVCACYILLFTSLHPHGHCTVNSSSASSSTSAWLPSSSSTSSSPAASTVNRKVQLNHSYLTQTSTCMCLMWYIEPKFSALYSWKFWFTWNLCQVPVVSWTVLFKEQ